MTRLCDTTDIADDTSKGFTVGEEHIFAVKKHGQIYVYQNKCPHLGVELNWLEDQFLDSEGTLIHCTTHGALFLIEDGECVSGPCQGEKLIAIPFTINNGEIHLS